MSAPTSACRSPCGAPSTGTGASSASTPARRSRPPGTSSSGCCGTAFPMSIIASARSSHGSRSARARSWRDFADGTREAGDLLVAADGFRSSVRAQLPAGGAAALCRLRRLARARRRERLCARRAPRPLRILRLLPAARRADARLSGRRARQRPAPGAPLLQPRLVPPGGRGDGAAAAADRRERRRPMRSRSPLPSSPRR